MTLSFSLVTYDLVVFSTIIGGWLNGRRILVRHSHLAPEEFGIFPDPDALARVFQRHGLGTDPELGAALRELERECGARLELKRVTHRLDPADAVLIRAAIRDV